MVKVIKLAHVGLNALDLSKQAEFYNDKWGLERIDEFGGEMFFRAEGPAHHVLTLHANSAAGMHHVALEVATPEDIDQAYYNANHHSLAFGEARDGQVAFNHAAFEMQNWEEWARAIFFAGERGIRRVWGPGRHLFGNNLFSYYKDPEGNTVEYTAEVEQITDPNRQPRLQAPFADQWLSDNRA